MAQMSIREIQLLMALGMFFLGALSFIVGVGVLVFRSLGSDVRAIESQTAKLAQKGLAEEISGLVGNASALLTAMNDLVHTARGIGIFLTLAGIGLMAVSILFALQIH